MKRPYRTSKRFRQVAQRAAKRRRDARYRLKLRMAGLTCRRTVPKNKIWEKHLFYSCRNETDRSRVRERINRRDHITAGRRCDGKPRKNQSWPQLGDLTGRERNLKYHALYNARRRSLQIRTRIDRAWHQFRATFQVIGQG